MSRPSLLSIVHSTLDTLNGSTPSHPFSKTYTPSTTALNSVISSTNQLNYSLAQLTNVPFASTKLVSLLKQDTAIQNTLNQSNSLLIAHSNTSRSGLYPDTTLFSPSAVIDRISTWGTTAGMEAFTDTGTSPGSKVNIVLGGKVLVVDLEFDSDKCQVASVKTSFAPSATSAPTLDTFLLNKIAAWINIIQQANDVMFEVTTHTEDPAILAARMSRDIQESFNYLMLLDALAEKEGIQWFTDIDHVSEAALEKVKTILGNDASTVDTLLTRVPLPLPYLQVPAISFLVWLSPHAYLQLLRSAPSNSPSTSPKLDVPTSHITSFLGMNVPVDGAVVATLKLVPSSNAPHNVSSDASDHTFPSSPRHAWILDFTSNSRGGIVITQTRARALLKIIGGIQSNDNSPSAAGIPPFAFGMPVQTPVNGGPNWLDLLLNVAGGTAEHYNAIYRSPSDSHPPLRLRLTTPQEPGFVLQQIPVKNVNEVSKVLEIVKDQCWLNETFRSLQWTPTQVPSDSMSDQKNEQDEVSPEFLTSLLSGSLAPRSIPVTIYLPSQPFSLRGSTAPPPPPNSTESDLFGGMDMDMDMDIPGLSMGMGMDMGMDMNMNMMMGGDTNSASNLTSTQPSDPKPTIVLSTPARAPRSGLMEVQVSFGDGGSATGMRVEVSDGMNVPRIEEIVRRGGIWSLPGRAWSQSSNGK
ncbi:hypothetical protein BJ138DRAFT_1145454 [Hygrophoropsis aurantiaca]|uniref:Uncharacterized protein n=1 Tax=Hygrophoropsis aurantiaca TaxID=72124 RepID=A0ACB8AK85_9AGAM|nr:hypothetical protein BJ138DRAFT_1145454 [Hygrophoropsis aurantiaca]